MLANLFLFPLGSCVKEVLLTLLGPVIEPCRSPLFEVRVFSMGYLQWREGPSLRQSRCPERTVEWWSEKIPRHVGPPHQAESLPTGRQIR